MKRTSLFQIGGIAVFLSAILTGIGRLIYFLSGQPDQPITLDLWRGIFAGALMVLGLGALFARQAQRGGVLGLVGYVFLVLATIYFVASDAVGLGVAAAVISNEQIAQIPTLVKNSAVVESSGLKHKGDVVHFDSASLRELGRRYAQAMQELQKASR